MWSYFLGRSDADAWGERSTISQGSFEQMGPFFTKLEQGSPIIILAWGTSITGDMGGAYHDSMAHLKAETPGLPNNYGKPFFGRGQVFGGWRSYAPAMMLAADPARWPFR